LAAPSVEAVARHQHLAEPQTPGCVRVDMHAHSFHSGDSTTTFDELTTAITSSGIDVLCLTDHHAIRGASALAESLRESGHRVICGEEIRSHTGEIIGLFINERIPFGMSAMETAKAIRDQGGIVYIPHPFDPLRRNLQEDSLRMLTDAGMVDAIEVINSKTSLSSLNARAAQFATDHDLLAGAGSDAHVPLAIGGAFVELEDFTDAASFLASLRSARVYGHHWDEPRPWTPRIVPAN
jgi:predicted metal-dependent phosphoesterase TrpH